MVAVRGDDRSSRNSVFNLTIIRGDDMSQAQLEWYGVPSSEAAKMTVLAGCRDMLREAAKQLRAMGMYGGHERMADLHADSADQILSA